MKKGEKIMNVVGIAHTYIAREKLIKAAKALGHALHMETQGTIGVEDELSAVDGGQLTERSMYTNPEDAARFADETGIDALAVSIGSSHGVYPKDMPP